jgi:8-oxo-dGTP pyrophosphatase MutT (NUDIX family)
MGCSSDLGSLWGDSGILDAPGGPLRHIDTISNMPERWKPSVTVAAIICATRDGVPHYLLVEEHTPEGLKLNNPAGHLDPGESPQQAAVREALEETAHPFTPEGVVGLYLARFVRPQRGEEVTYLRIAFCGTVGEPAPDRALDDGIVRTLWMTLPELRACVERHRSPLVLRCIEDHAAGRRFPLDLVHADPSLWQPLLLGPSAPGSRDGAGDF